MIKVIGASPDRVILKDLNDVIYYKQEKIYTDEQYKSSKNLQREIEQGRLVVSGRSEDKNYISDDSHFISPIEIKKDPPAKINLNSLLVKIEALENELANRPKASNIDLSIIEQLTNKISELEEKLSKKSPESNSDVLEAVKKLETKMESSSNNSILQKIDELINKAHIPYDHPMVKNKELPYEESSDERYVPNVTVEDANSHIKLNVRTIEKADDVDNALKALKDLKKKIT